MSEPIDFRALPKQWIVAPAPLPRVSGGKAAAFAGRAIHAAREVPLLRVLDAAGAEAALLIGWAILDGRFHAADATLALAPGETPEALFERLGGRFAMLWRRGGRLLARLDASGGLPAVHAAEHGLLAATTTLLELCAPLAPEPAVEAIFEFPRRRGFLPFGLTQRRGARRLLPNFELDLGSFAERRVWSADPAARVPGAEAPALAREAADILRRQTGAILADGPAILYLSGGCDSRLVLAACRGLTGRLRAETFGPPGSLETHIARGVAARAGIPHEAIPVTPARPEAVAAWLERTGHTFYDPVTDMTETVLAHAPEVFPLSGTGAEIGRASNWLPEDAEAARLDLARLRARIRMPDHPAINAAGEAWLASLPPMDAALALDMAKIEQIHACWAGVEVYGHAIPRPTLHPFSGQRPNALCLRLPVAYRLTNGFYRDAIGHLWPELGELPVNRAAGLDRLRFWRDELKARVPVGVKRWIKPLR
jgi:hypothetical protein